MAFVFYGKVCSTVRTLNAVMMALYPNLSREWLPGHAPDLIQQANAGRDRKYREKLLQFLFLFLHKNIREKITI